MLIRFMRIAIRYVCMHACIHGDAWLCIYIWWRLACRLWCWRWYWWLWRCVGCIWVSSLTVARRLLEHVCASMRCNVAITPDTECRVYGCVLCSRIAVTPPLRSTLVANSNTVRFIKLDMKVTSVHVQVKERAWCFAHWPYLCFVVLCICIL